MQTFVTFGLAPCFGGPHGEDRFGDHIVQRPAEHIRAAFDDRSGTAGCEVGVFVFFLHRFQFQVQNALGWTHQCDRTDQSGQFVYRIQYLFHFVGRLDIYGKHITVAGYRVNETLVHAELPQQLLLFDAVLIWPLFKIQVMKNSNGLPEIRFAAIAKLLRKPTQNIAHNAAVLSMKFSLVVFAEQIPGLGRRWYHGTAI